MANLREEIFKLTNPAPVFKDPEDNSDDETKAKLVDQEDLSFSDISGPSRLRQRNAIILADTDKRYAGKKTSRKALVDSDNDFGSDDDNNDDGDDSEQDDMLDGNSDILDDDDDQDHDDSASGGSESAENDEKFAKKFKKLKTQEFSFEDNGDYSKYADNESLDEEDCNDDESDDADEGSDDDMSDLEEEGDDLEDDDDEGIQKFSRAATDEVAKGQAAKQQLGLWDSLLEGRIKLQKAVSIVNQLPQKDKWSEFSSQSEEFMEESNKVQEVFTHLLGSLVHLQDLMLHQNTETRNQSKKDKQKKTTDDDDDSNEEIPSDSDEEMEQETVKQKSKLSLKRKNLDIDEYPGLLKKQHTDFHSYRDATIQKWFDKTRLATGKVKGKSFSAFDQSALVQINQILSDKERLIKRTQLKRSTYGVLGNTPKIEEPEILSQDQDTDNASSRDHLKDYDVEIFDDDDFYHQMLRELIEKKTTNVNDPVALSRQWLEIQKLRSKTKKVVDTKASKGRKVRYDVHKKLVNFMAPVETCDWTHEARDEFFKSLFGRRFQSMNL